MDAPRGALEPSPSQKGPFLEYHDRQQQIRSAHTEPTRDQPISSFIQDPAPILVTGRIVCSVILLGLFVTEMNGALTALMGVRGPLR